MATPYKVQSAIESLLHSTSEEHMCIPYAVYDEVIDDQEIREHYLDQLWNWLLRDTLDNINITIKIRRPERFTPGQRKRYFDRSYCEKMVTFILTDLEEEGEHPDFTAIRVIEKMAHLSDSLYFKGQKFGY